MSLLKGKDRICSFCEETIPETKVLIQTQQSKATICEDCIKAVRDKMRSVTTKKEKTNET